MRALLTFGVLVVPLLSAIGAACVNCVDYQPPVAWGSVTGSAIGEASGVAASRRNVGVLWTHNDGARERVFAIATNGPVLATFNFTENVDDLEDIAVGPGPVPGIPYLYIGDIGGNGGTNTSRAKVRIVRAPEPRVDLSFAGAPPTSDMNGVESFTLLYPDGSYDAEALMVDPILLDVIVVTKDPVSTRVYRANVANATNRAEITLQFLTTLSFTNVSGGDISHDGSKIVLRREDAAFQWARCDNEPLADALTRAPEAVPVVGPPAEPNGEGIAFVSAGSGYVTLSEGTGSVIYFFEGHCAAAPQFTLPLSDQTAFVGGDARFEAMATAYPPPAFRWRFNGSAMEGQSNSYLTLSGISDENAGTYELTFSNVHGTVASSATLHVRPKPNLQFTEVMPSAAVNTVVNTADWWELTSFEEQSVTLSGWRFNDNAGGLSDAYIFPSGVAIAPGESIIFVENLSAQEFRDWWGASNLPPSLQIVSYNGSGLGLGAGGDGLRLWNSVTTNTADTVAGVDFGAADAGVSFNFDPNTAQFGAKSVLGINGVFRAAAGTDIGSPGRIVAPATPPLLAVERLGDTLRLHFSTQNGHRYSLQARDGLETEAWADTGDVLIATNNANRRFEKLLSNGSRFFRLAVD